MLPNFLKLDFTCSCREPIILKWKRLNLVIFRNKATILIRKPFNLKLDFFGKSDQIHSKLRIQSHLLKKSLMENFIFCAVWNYHVNWSITQSNFVGIWQVLIKHFLLTFIGTGTISFLSFSHIFMQILIRQEINQWKQFIQKSFHHQCVIQSNFFSA